MSRPSDGLLKGLAPAVIAIVVVNTINAMIWPGSLALSIACLTVIGVASIWTKVELRSFRRRRAEHDSGRGHD